MANEVESWTKTLVTVLLIPIVLLVLGSYFVPKMIDESNRREALRTARLKKSLDVYTQDTQFTSKLNGVETSMQIFDQLSVRRKLIPSEIKKAQDQFQAEYKERYLALDEIAWWWYWQLEKESSVFELLSPSELQTLHDLIGKYHENIRLSVHSVHPLFQYLSSPGYGTRKVTRNQYEYLERNMTEELDRLYYERTGLVKDIAKLFTESQYDRRSFWEMFH